MRVGNWIVFFSPRDSADILNAYVKADSMSTALAFVAKWNTPVTVHGILSPEVQDQLHLS